ncbi:MAG: hypothetical protein methR_P0330 [Methyloprofundus sp.]|nr:MAG: hypothetical protein methR_P0330 [Methyloprofundus sp.]
MNLLCIINVLTNDRDIKMKRVLIGIILVGVLGACASNDVAQKTEIKAEVTEKNQETNGVVITSENFIHADSVRAYLKEIAFTGSVNKLRHLREVANTDNQDVIRMNRDTLYTRIIIDAKEGATVTLPKYDGLQIVALLDENHQQIKELNGEGTLKITKDMLSVGQHGYIIVRTGFIAGLSDDEKMERAYAAQDGIAFTAKSNAPYVPSVKYDFSTMDAVKYDILRNFALNLPENFSVGDGAGLIGERDEETAKVVVAIGWGFLPKSQAAYASFTGYREREVLTIKSPELKEKGFFSYTLYDDNGWIATNDYAINSDDMIQNKDGTYTVTFLASGEPVQKNDLNVVRTPRGKYWTAVLRSYNPVDPEANQKLIDGYARGFDKQLKIY